MPKKINISIPTPCHEKWEAMSPTDKGRFCASCQKNVMDFTKASDRQVAEFYKNNPNACGLFLDTQLNRDLLIPKEKSRFWAAASAAVLSFFAVGTGQALAQSEPVATQETISKGLANKTVSLYISGTVVNEHNKPIPGVKVTNKYSTLQTVTDHQGRFTIKAAPGDTLKFTDATFETRKIKVTNATEYTVALEFKEKPIRKPLHIMGRYL